MDYLIFKYPDKYIMLRNLKCSYIVTKTENRNILLMSNTFLQYVKHIIYFYKAYFF